ncbi:MAG TPA: hypothetical protein VIA18_21625 [Polyangia bacterium]|jgi:hypothetical protein|nr:hypothetical protein [Polyangia bacterium]
MIRLSPLRPAAFGGFFALTLAAAGCGNSVDHDSAVKVMNLALTGTVAADGQVVSVNLQPNGGTVTASLTNLLGKGTANIDGSLLVANNVTSTKLDVALDDWQDPLQNLTLQGSLHEVGDFTSPLPLIGDVKLTGALAASGSINATVDFDLHGTYSLTGLHVTGDVGGQSMGSGIEITLK